MNFRLCFTVIALLTLCSCGGSNEPSPEEQQKNARELQRTFIGNWRVFNDAGNFFYISIKPDGTVSSTWDKGQQGKWEMVDSKILLVWNDGWKDVIYADNGSFKKEGYEPGKAIDDDPTSEAQAEKVEAIPSSS